MKKNHLSLDSSNFEDLLELATEDISFFYDEVLSWSSLSAGEDEVEPDLNSQQATGELLGSMAAGYGRGQLQLARLAPLMTGADQVYHQKLQRLFQNGENLFIKILTGNQDRVATCFQQDSPLWKRLQVADQQLRRVRRIAQDGLCFENQDWQQPELAEAGNEFLVLFCELAWLARCPQPALHALPEFQAWQQSFQRLENLFHQWFGCFHPIQEILTQVGNREAGAAFWWFMETPPDTSEGCVISERQMQSLGKLLQDREEEVEDHSNVSPPAHLIAMIRGPQPQTKQAVVYDTPEAYMAAIQAAPAYLLMPEARDMPLPRPEHRHQVTLNYPSVSAIGLEQEGGLAAILQAATIEERSLPAHAADRQQTSTFAKVARVRNEKLSELNLVPLENLDFGRHGKHFTVMGSLSAGLGLPPDVRWFCDLLLADGSILPASSFAVETANDDTLIFNATFEFEDEDDHEQSPPGNLRLLIMLQE